MPRMRLPNGKVYEVPQSDVEVAINDYGAAPVDSVGSTESNPLAALAGGISSGVNALGGVKGLATIGAAGGGAYYGARKLFGGRGAPAIPAASAPAPVAAPAASTATQAQSLEQLLGGGGQSVTGPPAARPTAKASRTTQPKEKPATRKINVQGKPKARAPQPTDEPKYTGGRGKSGPQLQREAAMRAGKPVPGTVAAAAAAERAGAPDPELWRTRGISSPRGRAIGAVGPPALEALLFLLNASRAQEDMNAADDVIRSVREQDMPAYDPRRRAKQSHGL